MIRKGYRKNGPEDRVLGQGDHPLGRHGVDERDHKEDKDKRTAEGYRTAKAEIQQGIRSYTANKQLLGGRMERGKQVRAPGGHPPRQGDPEG